MSHDYRRVENAFHVLTQYSGDIPLDNFLRSTFKQNKNWGSKDRRAYREICFRFYRHHRRDELSKELVSNINAGLNGEEYQSEYNPYSDLGFETSVGKVDLGIWFQNRPPVFVTGSEENITILINELEDRDAPFIKYKGFIESPAQLSVAHYPILENLQIMDRASLEACKGLDIKEKDIVWDACAGAGGKTFALSRIYRPEKIISSDVRKKSLSNLQKRSQLLNQFAITEVIDATIEMPEVSPTVIFIDAPCSGSGTWRRNPDRAAYFGKDQLDSYVKKQRAILSNIAQNASSGTQIIYVTCSVFKQENEDQVQHARTLGLDLIKSEMLGGASINSDYFFRAIFKKP